MSAANTCARSPSGYYDPLGRTANRDLRVEHSELGYARAVEISTTSLKVGPNGALCIGATEDGVPFLFGNSLYLTSLENIVIEAPNVTINANHFSDPGGSVSSEVVNVISSNTVLIQQLNDVLIGATGLLTSNGTGTNLVSSSSNPMALKSLVGDPNFISITSPDQNTVHIGMIPPVQAFSAPNQAVLVYNTSVGSLQSRGLLSSKKFLAEASGQVVTYAYQPLNWVVSGTGDVLTDLGDLQRTFEVNHEAPHILSATISTRALPATNPTGNAPADPTNLEQQCIVSAICLINGVPHREVVVNPDGVASMSFSVYLGQGDTIRWIVAQTTGSTPQTLQHGTVWSATVTA